MIQDAEAYKQAVMSKAQGDAERFLSVYKAYAGAKDVTQKRIYIETMQQILENSKKVIVGSGGNAPLLPYLPLDQLKPAAKTPPAP
jgi:membrane protease subunit HflK